MTEDEQGGEQSEQVQESLPREAFIPPDFFLEFMLTTLDAGDEGKPTDSNMALTVTVGGSIISGDAISQASWIDRTMSAVEASNPTWGGQTRGVFEEWLAAGEQSRAEREAAGRPRIRHHFLHFDNAVFHAGGEDVRIGLVRVKVDEVQAWSMGKWTRA